MDVVPAIYRTVTARLLEGHVLRDLGRSVMFLEKGNPNPYWVNAKRVTFPSNESDDSLYNEEKEGSD